MAILSLPTIPSLGERLGTALGTGLSSGLVSGLQTLAQNKMQELSQRSKAGGLQALGLPTELLGLPENLQALVLKELLAAPRNQTFAQGLENLLNPQAPAPNPGTSTSPMGALNEKQALDLARIAISQQKLKLQEDQAEKKAKAQESQFERKEKRDIQKEINKETLPFYSKINEAASGAKENQIRLDRMTQLINSGYLSGPWTETALSLFKIVGVNLEALTSPPESEEFRKLSADFLKNAKAIFGARLTNFDIESFLKTVPTLMQSDAGKKRVIRNLSLLNQGAAIKKRKMDEIIESNLGERPKNLEILVEKKSAPEIEALAKEFQKGPKIKEKKLTNQQELRAMYPNVILPQPLKTLF